jgi:hypothetical protein
MGWRAWDAYEREAHERWKALPWREKLPRLILAVIALTTFATTINATPDCDAQTGEATTEPVKVLNRLKSRTEIPTPQEIDNAVTLSAMVQPGDDRNRWTSSMAATVMGYVADVQLGGVESVNCHAKDAAHRDTHIDLVVSAEHAEDKTKHVVVEVTPQMRVTHLEWTTANLRKELLGRCVRITGWMMFDAVHANESFNTAATNPKDWRVTAWEIHPITDITMLPSCSTP